MKASIAGGGGTELGLIHDLYNDVYVVVLHF